MKKLILLYILASAGYCAQAQDDSTETWSHHFQLTVIDMGHPAFNSPYSGQNSLQAPAEEALSLTTTLFLGHKLWRYASVYFNPEIAGGRGVSDALGVAGFPNGETFRIGNPSPTLYMARLFFRQYIPLGEGQELVDADANQLREYVPKKRIEITAGKFALSDIFDNNAYSHDPRSQFMNWALMSNGAWDYPANTRGYTDAVALQYITPSWSVGVSGSLEPTYANGPDLDYNYFKAHGQNIEFTKSTSLGGHAGVIRLLGYRNVSKAPAYQDVINAYLNKTDQSLNVVNGTTYGGVKYGFGLNAEQELTKDLGAFLRAGWNDGKTATWAFTEIDRDASLGLSYKGTKWNRPDDVFGIAGDVNGISKEHREFLALGGYGFLIGDGQLTNYKTEDILETYYSAKLDKTLFVSADYQFIANPGYNGDRGPVSFFSLRAHVEF